jgi:hypothetical protein
MAIGCFQTDERLLYVRDRRDVYWVRRFVSGVSINLAQLIDLMMLLFI